MIFKTPVHKINSFMSCVIQFNKLQIFLDTSNFYCQVKTRKIQMKIKIIQIIKTMKKMMT